MERVQMKVQLLDGQYVTAQDYQFYIRECAFRSHWALWIWAGITGHIEFCLDMREWRVSSNSVRCVWETNFVSQHKPAPPLPPTLLHICHASQVPSCILFRLSPGPRKRFHQFSCHPSKFQACGFQNQWSTPTHRTTRLGGIWLWHKKKLAIWYPYMTIREVRASPSSTICFNSPFWIAGRAAAPWTFLKRQYQSANDFTLTVRSEKPNSTTCLATPRLGVISHQPTNGLVS